MPLGSLATPAFLLAAWIGVLLSPQPRPENPPRPSPCEGTVWQDVIQTMTEPASNSRNQSGLPTQTSFFYLGATRISGCHPCELTAGPLGAQGHVAELCVLLQECSSRLRGSSWLSSSYRETPQAGHAKRFARMCSSLLVTGPRSDPGPCSWFDSLCCPQPQPSKGDVRDSERPQPRTLPQLTIPRAGQVVYSSGFTLESPWGCFSNTDVWRSPTCHPG